MAVISLRDDIVHFGTMISKLPLFCGNIQFIRLSLRGATKLQRGNQGEAAFSLRLILTVTSFPLNDIWKIIISRFFFPLFSLDNIRYKL